MSEAPRKMLFNRHRLPSDVDLEQAGLAQPGDALDLEADEPIVQLSPGENERLRIKRVPTGLTFRFNSSLFGTSLDWAHREYIVHRLSATGEAGRPSYGASTAS